MKYLSILICICLVAAAAAAQSGRIKPGETPSPTPAERSPRVYVPTQVNNAPAAPQHSPNPTNNDSDVIKVDASLVPIPISVLDAAGRAITNLKAADFELRIDGKPAEIGEVSRSESPIRLAMLFDNSSSVLIARDFEKEAAVKFFRRIVRPDRDMAALFSLADFTRLEQPLTHDVSMLTQAIVQFPPPKGATALLDGMIEVAEYLRSAQGRRVVVIVSDGEDTYSDMRTTLDDVIVDTKDFENYKRTGVRGGNANIRALTAERRMIEVATQTGGAVYSPIDENELSAAFNQISAELSQQYILSYYPEEAADSIGQFRAISVAVKGRPDVTLRTRKGYYVGKAAAASK